MNEGLRADASASSSRNGLTGWQRHPVSLFVRVLRLPVPFGDALIVCDGAMRYAALRSPSAGPGCRAAIVR